MKRTLRGKAFRSEAQGGAGMTMRAGRTWMLVFGTLLAALAAAVPAPAQEFPAKPVDLVLPFGPGGSHDLTARAVASVAHQYLGQPLLVVLRPGGGGAVGSQQVIRARPDGYTLLFGGTGPNTIFALVQKAPIRPDPLVPPGRPPPAPSGSAPRLTPQIPAGKRRALAVTGPKRLGILPAVPTVK